jgi:tRNA dimethylallyltransferase
MSVLPNAEIAARTRPARISAGFIVGPTGAGKSALAMEVANRTNCEIVNADSRQFYRGMDLGTAKPSVVDRRRVPHHLIDVRDPDESLDVAEFAQLARAIIDDIAARGRNPLVVGGSGLYLRVIRGGIFHGPRICIRNCARSILKRRIESASTTCTESCGHWKSSS